MCLFFQLVTRKQGDVQIEGFNPSAEEASEGTDEAVESGVDVVLNHRLSETYAFGDKKGFTAYLKEYMKKLVVINIFQNLKMSLQYLLHDFILGLSVLC
jgi:hypothetical protein